MRFMRALISFVLLLVAGSVSAQSCPYSLTAPERLSGFDGLEVRIDGPAAAGYAAVITFDDERIAPMTATATTLFDGSFWIGSLPRLADELDATVTIFVTTMEGTACRLQTTVTLEPNSVLEELAGRVVVPIAGSAPGAFDSRWKTSLLLRGFGTGTIYFRPRGTFFGDERDPSLRYDLGGTVDEPLFGILYSEDVMIALGATGIGNLDIVPDRYEGDGARVPGHYAPTVTAHVFNDGQCGPVGGDVPVLYPDDIARTETIRVPLVRPIMEKSRIQVGVRTFDRPVDIDVSAFSWGGGLKFAQVFTLPANSFEQFSVTQLLGRDLEEDDESVLLFFAGGPAASYYSVTSNESGDTRVYTGIEMFPREVGDPILTPVSP